MRFITLLLFFFGSAQSYRMFTKQASSRFGSLALNAAIKEQEGPLYEQIAVIGGVNKFDGETGSVNANFFEILHEKKLAKKILCLFAGDSQTDNFAKKRLTNPSTVYNGLLDIMEFHAVNSQNILDISQPHWSIAATLGTLPNRSDCVIALNVQPEEVLPYCHMCQFYNISRLIVTVDYSGIEDDLEGGILDQCFVEKNGFYYTGIDPSTNAVIIGNNTYTKFTIFKVGQMVEGKEGEAAYRIVSNEKRVRVPKPSRGYGNVPLQSGDLNRVVVESLTLPNADRKVFAIGPGTQLDYEVETYMKSQGWSPRYQVNMLMGPMMSRIRKKIRAVSSNMNENADDDDEFHAKVEKYIEQQRIADEKAEAEAAEAAAAAAEAAKAEAAEAEASETEAVTAEAETEATETEAAEGEATVVETEAESETTEEAQPETAADVEVKVDADEKVDA